MSSRVSRFPDLPIPFGKYVLRERIGKGGMAEIFRATAQGASGFQKELVIKRMLPSLTDDPGFADVIVREAKIAVTLRHQNIVQVFELGEVDDQYYMAMEYLHGRDLRNVLARADELDKEMPLGLAVYIAMEVAKALDYAHDVRDANGKPIELVHRDISPTNLMASFAGEIKVLDFGIAKAEVSDYVTREGLIKGNCPYMSPEQIAGQAVNQQSDLFSLGSTLYELLTGKRAFEAPTQIAIMQRIYAEPPLPPSLHRQEIPARLEAVVLRLLDKDRSKRFQTAAEAHHALAELIGKDVPATSSFELSRFLTELYGDDVLRESRSLPPEGETADQQPFLPPNAAAEDGATEGGRREGATRPIRIRVQTPPIGVPPPESVGASGERVTTRPIDGLAVTEAKRAPSVHTRRMVGTVAVPEEKAPTESLRLWAIPAVMLVALGVFMAWPTADPAPRYRPRPDRVTHTEPVPAPRPPAPRPTPTEPVVVVVPAPDPPPRHDPTKQTSPRPTQPTGKLRLSSEPWANVAIDGRRITKPTPLVDYPIASGSRVVTLSHPGFKTARRVVRITPGETSLLRVVLERL